MIAKLWKCKLNVKYTNYNTEKLTTTHQKKASKYTQILTGVLPR